MEQSLSWVSGSYSSGQEINFVRATQIFITGITKAHYSTLPWASWFHVTLSHHIFLRSILILSSICHFLPSDFFSQDFRLNFTCICYGPVNATCLAHPILLDLVVLIVSVNAFTNYIASHYVPNSVHLPAASSLLKSQYSPQHFVIKHTMYVLNFMLSVPWKYNGWRLMFLIWCRKQRLILALVPYVYHINWAYIGNGRFVHIPGSCQLWLLVVVSLTG